MLITGLRLGLTGLVIRCMCACSGVRPPFFTLHLTQQQTMFSHVLLPPWLLGFTWSSDSSVVGIRLPQYWHLLPSQAAGGGKCAGWAGSWCIGHNQKITQRCKPQTSFGRSSNAGGGTSGVTMFCDV